jgi:hypothetical protein
LKLGRLVCVCVFALGAVALVGCQEVVESTTHSFSVTESLPDLLSTPPSQGVQICQADTDNCDTTDANGRAELTVPFNQEITFTLEKEGFGSYIFGNVSDVSRPSEWRMYPHEQLEAIAEQLGIMYPWERGMASLNTIFPAVAGVTFTPVGSTINMVGELFYYDEATSQYSLNLEATTSAPSPNLLPLGQGGFTKVAQGEQQFELGGTVGDCSDVSLGWPGDTPNRIRVPVRDGYTTYGSMVCPGP